METIERRPEPVGRAVDPAVRPRVGVVLAAGWSRRLARVTGGHSKALLRVGGLTLVQRAVRTLLVDGVHEVIVVLGYQGAKVAAAVETIAPGRVRTVTAARWRDGNGASLAAAEPLVAGEPLFALVTVDHLFGDDALAPLLDAGRPAALVDHAPDPDTWAEGTRVALHEEFAVGFSKELDAPSVDCGAFLLPASIFDSHREAAAAGDHSLAGAISLLAARQPLCAVPLPAGSWWHDVDTPADLRAVRRKLRRDLGKPGDGPVSRWLNRPVSTRISMAIAPLGVHPDVISWLALAFAAGAAILLAMGLGLWAALAVQLTSVIDGVDGEVARLQQRASAAGALLDGVLDRVSDTAIVAALGIWAVTVGTSPTAGVTLVAAATALSILSMATKDRVTALGLPPAPERAIGYLLGGRDGRMLLVAVGALIGRPTWALVAIVVAAGTSLVVRVASVRAARADATVTALHTARRG
jgi:1L-myo-inositol 1-phosphate cytidylyltransferase / CDP-L-myo-inositol myo-inositolphosphotransferase